MHLEELQQQWQRLEQKLDHALALESEMVRQAIMQPAHRRLNRLTIWPMIDLVFCVCVLLAIGTFLSNHWHDWHLAMPAVVVMAGTMALLISSIVLLQRMAQLDWSGPVAEIQGSLEMLRATKIRQFKWIILLSPLVGFCALIVGLHWLFTWLSEGRVNILDKFDPWWIMANYAFGILFVPLGYLLAGVLAKRCHRHRWWQAVLDGISGTSLKAARLDVERWASLQQEK